MNLSFLEVGIPLTKSYSKRQDGTLEKKSYPHVYEVTSITESWTTLQDFEKLLTKHAAAGHCLLKSNPKRPLVNESRAGSTDATGTTEWIVLDIDGLPNCKDVEDLMKALHMEDISYVVQYSASYKLENNDLRCHIFMQLAKPIAAPMIKQWLVHLNHTVSMLRDAMSLTKTGNSLSWPLDISACQNDKLLYIAPPVLGKGIKDPFTSKQPRIQFIKKAKDTLAIPATFSSQAQNQEQTAKRVAELRTAQGLPTRKVSYKIHGGNQVMNNPDSAVINDMKVERGFVYFNINGGDSWGYYHPEDNPDYIYNFKDEPVYMTKDLLPEYWKQLSQQATRTSSQGITYLAFCDRKTGAYYRGTHDTQTDELELYIAKNETQVRHFAKQHGMPLGDYIPEWDMIFDPHSDVRVDATNKVANIFEPTEFMTAKPPKVKPKNCPPLIWKIIHHALGGDIEVTEHFINWLAYILQNRDQAKTAWVLHGTQGTGKGVLMNRILRPIFGAKHTAARRMEDLNEQWNGYIEQCFIVFVDEVEAKALINERGVMAKLKNFITEPQVTVRLMHQAAHEVRNYSNWIFASNKTDPVTIDKEDRRFNVGKYQKDKLVLTTQELETGIPAELQGFHDYLMAYIVDDQAASTPIDSEDRNNMISISQSSVDTVVSALLEGDFEFFIDQLPASSNANWSGNALEFNRVENYKQVLKDLMTRTMPAADGKCNISRDELRVLFEYTVGNIPSTPNKFTSMLKHHRIHTTKVWVEDRSVYGLPVFWKDRDRFPEYEKAFSPVKGKIPTKS